jgi:hypothetical protein
MADVVLHRGRVTRRDGLGVPGALVWVARGTAPSPEIAIRCDADGGFRIALLPGSYVIEASSPDGEVGEITVDTGASPLALKIVVGKPP